MSIHISSSEYLVAEPLIEITDKAFLEMPTLLEAVPGGRLCSELADKLILLDALEGEFIGRIVPCAETLHIHERAWIYLIELVPDTCCLVLDIPGLEPEPRGIRFGYDVEVQAKRQKGYHHRGDHVRQHHAMVADASGQGGYDLRVRGHL